MKLDVLSFGVVGPFGRGRAQLAEAMLAPPPAPGMQPAGRNGASIAVRRVDDAVVQDPALNPARRAGRFIRMTMLAAADCLKDAGLDEAARKRMGLVLVTGMGAHEANFGFVDGLLDFGMNQGSPTLFSHSVHNASNSYIAVMSGSRGPALTITHFVTPLHQGLDAAGLWLNGGICDHVLLCAADELGAYMLAMYATLGFGAPGAVVPGEGASAFLLARADSGSRRIGQIGKAVEGEPAPAAVILDKDNLWAEGAAEPRTPAHVSAACYNPLWGAMPTGTGFAVAASLCAVSSGTPGVLCHTARPGATEWVVTK